jgi:hypothetical protein
MMKNKPKIQKNAIYGAHTQGKAQDHRHSQEHQLGFIHKFLDSSDAVEVYRQYTEKKEKKYRPFYQDSDDRFFFGPGKGHP